MLLYQTIINKISKLLIKKLFYNKNTKILNKIIIKLKI